MALLLLLPQLALPTVAQSTVTLTLTDDVAEGVTLSPGDTVTYFVTVTENQGGFCAGTFYFRASDSLQYESASLLGEETDALRAITGENEGNYGIIFLDPQNFPGEDVILCTVSFLVIGLESVSVELIPYQVIRDVTPEGAAEPVTESVEVRVIGADPHPVVAPDKPVILTESLSVGVIGKSYSSVLTADTDAFLSWELTGGELPRGLTLLNDGTLSGIPEEAGEFTFSVTASILEIVSSEEKTLTLTVLEKPKTIELTSESFYRIEEEDNVRYLLGVTAETALTELLTHFLDPDSLTVCKASGETVTGETTFIGTGFAVRLIEGDTILDEVTVVVLGDTDGNGRIGTLDYLRIKGHFRGSYDLIGAYLKAARVSGRETVGTLDYLRVKAHFRGQFNIYA